MAFAMCKYAKKMIAQYYTSSVLVLTFVLILSKYDNTAVLAACEILRIYSNVGLGSSLRGEPGPTTFRSQGCP